MKTIEKILFTGLLIMIAALTSALVLPPHKSAKLSSRYDGIIAVPGLSDSVTVYLDERGMPHIYAFDEHDLYFAVGYISARERLWQMDLIRRSAAGRLSEIFGKSFLQADIFTRCLRINEKSKLILKNEDREIVACLQAYTDGVNAFINSAGSKLPVEFRLLKYTPEEWSVEDILSIIGLMGWSLDYRNLSAELFFTQLVRKAGVKKVSGLIPEWKAVKNFAYPDFNMNDTLISQTRAFITSYDRILKLGISAFSGSNNWAVSGNRTVTGMPLLSNDMHLSLNAPCIWIQMHQIIPGKLNVTGVAIPGEPFIVAGHNKKIAWGMTNLRVDAVDLYAEKINPGNRNQYLFNGEWKEMKSVKEIIRIKGGKQDTLEIRFTHRGPIISGLMRHNDDELKIKWLGYEYLPGLSELENISLSMKWSGWDSSNEARTMYLLNRANGWDDFRSGLETFRSISQNFVYSDTDGNIGLHVGGGIPVRKGNGIMIRSGETDEYDWKGYVPFNRLPFSFNPQNGEVSSANNKTVNDDYPYFISQSYDVPYRINRIRQMLDKQGLFDTEDFKRMVTDQHSDLARLLTPHILKLTNSPERLTTAERTALNALSGWDYDMDPEEIAPTIFEFFRINFKRNLLADEMEFLYDQMWEICGEYYVYRILVEGPDEWVDNVGTIKVETIEDIVLQSFKDAINSLAKEYGKDPGNWEWGKIHTLTIAHPLGSVRVLKLIYKLNSDKYAVGGSDHTVCPYFTYDTGFKTVYGASMRHIYNAADWDESYSVIPGGVSGVPGSEFYLSQVKTYIDGKFYKDHFSDEAVKTNAKYTLILTKQK